MNRPYRDAVRQLTGAWEHLKMRRSKGDNEARKLLRSAIGGIALPLVHETLRLDYAPAIIAEMNAPSKIREMFGVTQL